MNTIWFSIEEIEYLIFYLPWIFCILKWALALRIHFYSELSNAQSCVVYGITSEFPIKHNRLGKSIPNGRLIFRNEIHYRQIIHTKRNWIKKKRKKYSMLFTTWNNKWYGVLRVAINVFTKYFIFFFFYCVDLERMPLLIKHLLLLDWILMVDSKTW